ncbi:MAG TPA: hypothetical protein VGB63_07970 [Pedobacter sp.]|jgi:hypothetical protein
MSSLLNPILATIILFCSFTLKAQYAEFIGSTEQQIKEKLAKDYPIVYKDSVDHGLIPVLTFENSEHISKASFYFFPTCYMIRSWAPVRFLDAYINIANRRYEKIGDNVWKTRRVKVTIVNTGNQVLTTFTKLPLGKEI